jgi:hypothetical protein
MPDPRDPAQITQSGAVSVGELGRSYVACGCALAGKGHYGATCRFGFGAVRQGGSTTIGIFPGRRVA